MKHSFVNKWLQFSNYTLAIKYDSSFQLMKRLCDDTSLFVLASIRGAFQEEEVWKDLRPQWSFNGTRRKGSSS